MNGIKPNIEQTDDGSATLRHPIFGDTYHSTRGAVGESKHVFIDNGLATCRQQSVRILEIGFGSGLNAWQSLCYGRQNDITLDYTTIELYPVDIATAAAVGYTEDPLFTQMHKVEWNIKCRLTDNFNLTKYQTDLTATNSLWRNNTYDLIYFDAFAPDTQPEMWSAAVFRMMYDVLEYGGILVTYSAKGVVKQALRDAGFIVRRLPGALGKRHMLRAEKLNTAECGIKR